MCEICSKLTTETPKKQGIKILQILIESYSTLSTNINAFVFKDMYLYIYMHYWNIMNLIKVSELAIFCQLNL